MGEVNIYRKANIIERNLIRALNASPYVDFNASDKSKSDLSDSDKSRTLIIKASCGSGKQQWRIPDAVGQILFDHGFDHEGFGAAANRALPGGKFCSIFKQEWTLPNCMGSFFNAFKKQREQRKQSEQRKHSEQKWYCFPPMIDEIINRALNLIIDARCECVFIMPYWPDCEAYQRLAAENIPVEIGALVARSFSLVTIWGKKCKPSTSYVILHIRPTEKIIDKMLSAF